MSYIIRGEEFQRDLRYAKLETKTANINRLVQDWMDEATLLHTDSPTVGDDRASLIALRDQFVLDLRAILGV